MQRVTERSDFKFKKKLEDLVEKEYIALEFYKGTHIKILFQHNCEYCGRYRFLMRPHDFFKGQRCPYCQKHFKKSTKDISRELRITFKGKISLVGEYKGAKERILIRCNTCGRKHYIWPKEIVEGTQICYCEQVESERNLLNNSFIKYNLYNENNVKQDYKIQDIFTNQGPQFDWFIKRKNFILAINYMDQNHYREIYSDPIKFKYIKNWDQIKKDFCEINNIYYLRIPFWELDRSDFIAERIQAFLNGKENKVAFSNLKKELDFDSYTTFKTKRAQSNKPLT